MEASGEQPGAYEGEEASDSQDADSQFSDPSLIPNYDHVPAEYRQHLDPIIKEMSSNVGKKLEDNANYRKQWEPYEELGITDYEPETVNDLLGLLQLMNDPDQFKQWYDAVGEQYGFADSRGGVNEDEFDDEYDGELDEEALSPEEFQAAIDSRVEEALSPFMQQQEQMEEQQALAEADNTIDEQLNAIREQFGDFDDETERDICKLALAYDGENAIEKGFEDYRRIVGDAQNDLFSKAEGQPETPEGEGMANTTAERPTTMKDAEALARERLAQMGS